MKARRYAIVLGILAAVLGLLLGSAIAVYAGHQTSAYCLDMPGSFGSELVRRPIGESCAEVREVWADSWQPVGHAGPAW